jgi:hypothetical protein
MRWTPRGVSGRRRPPPKVEAPYVDGILAWAELSCCCSSASLDAISFRSFPDLRRGSGSQLGLA